jgi:signal transduction histidine kinase
MFAPTHLLAAHQLIVTNGAAAVGGAVCGRASIAAPVSMTAGQQLADFFTKILSTDDFPARWHCGNWTDFHGWLYILSDVAIWAAYFAIPFLLFRVLIKRKDVALNGMIYIFLAFVLLCGLTHLVDALIFWWPVYRLSAILRFATAIVSIFAAYALNRVFPMLLGLRSIRELKIEILRRKKTEERLSASEFLLSEAGRIAGVGGWEHDLISDKRIWSKTVYNILEMPFDQDLSENPLSYYPEPYRALLDHAIEDAMQNGSKWDIEMLAITQKNKTLWVRHIGEPVFNNQGEVVKFRGTLMDIDQYKKHELELSRALEVTLEQKQQLKNFAYVLSHHIRNHTSNISGLSDLIDVESIGKDNKELIVKSRQVTNDLMTTLDDLARVIETQDRTLLREQVSFKNIASGATEAQSFQIKKAGAQIVQDFEIEAVSFPRLYMESIFKHLLSNALRYRDLQKGLRVELRSFRNSEGEVILEFKDNGLGMDLSLYGHKLFNLYTTFHESISSRGASLYLIKTQIESQAGKITATSFPGEGSTFQITFSNSDT